MGTLARLVTYEGRAMTRLVGPLSAPNTGLGRVCAAGRSSQEGRVVPDRAAEGGLVQVRAAGSRR